eukprot:scaffold220530_cov29-Tisochrysis_lutea.AAC.2
MKPTTTLALALLCAVLDRGCALSHMCRAPNNWSSARRHAASPIVWMSDTERSTGCDADGAPPGAPPVSALADGQHEDSVRTDTKISVESPDDPGAETSMDQESSEDAQLRGKKQRRFKGPLPRLRLRSRLSHAGRAVMHVMHAVVGSLQPAICKIVGLAVKDPDLRDLAATTISWVTWGSLLLSGLGTLGVDIKPLLSLSTLAGFAISISTKNILSDTFSAAYVIWIRPFKRGDTIKIAGSYEGEVMSIDAHFVRLKLQGGKEILMPTHSIYGKVVERSERPAGSRYRRSY